jgi:aminopeptidase N
MTKRFVRAVLCTALLTLAVGAGVASAASFTPGSPGLGDPMFPNAGNGGYDVQHYDLKLDYAPATSQLAATAVITAKATQDLSSFNLDFRGFNISTVTVNGVAAKFARKGQELTITTAGGLRRNRDFTARVVYSGHVNDIRDPDHARDGWIPTEDGAYVANEPQGVPSWMPVNDSLKDFATWDFTVTVPKGRTVMANGILVSKTDSGDDLALARELADGVVPRHRDKRRLRAAHRDAGEWPSAVRRRGPADALLR